MFTSASFDSDYIKKKQFFAFSKNRIYDADKPSARPNASSIFLDYAMHPRALSVKLIDISIIFRIFT